MRSRHSPSHSAAGRSTSWPARLPDPSGSRSCWSQQGRSSAWRQCCNPRPISASPDWRYGRRSCCSAAGSARRTFPRSGVRSFSSLWRSWSSPFLSSDGPVVSSRMPGYVTGASRFSTSKPKISSGSTISGTSCIIRRCGPSPLRSRSWRSCERPCSGGWRRSSSPSRSSSIRSPVRRVCDTSPMHSLCCS